MWPEISEIPSFYQQYAWQGLGHTTSDTYPDFKWITCLETRFADLVECDLSDVVEVILWGMPDHQNPQVVINSLVGARAAISVHTRRAIELGNQGEFELAWQELRTIPGLGGIGVYASKLLRFRYPDDCGAYDTVIANAPDSGTYPEFLCRLGEYRDTLNRDGHPSPDGSGRPWRAADVEMAVWTALRQRTTTPG